MFNLAVTKLREGRAPEAEGLFRSLANDRPDDPQVRNGLAIALASQGKLKEAEAEFLAALRIDPTFEKASQGLEKVRRLLAARERSSPVPPR
jgi:Flp pilus assembly protein TadD